MKRATIALLALVLAGCSKSPTAPDRLAAPDVAQQVRYWSESRGWVEIWYQPTPEIPRCVDLSLTRASGQVIIQARLEGPLQLGRKLPSSNQAVQWGLSAAEDFGSARWYLMVRQNFVGGLPGQTMIVRFQAGRTQILGYGTCAVIGNTFVVSVPEELWPYETVYVEFDAEAFGWDVDHSYLMGGGGWRDSTASSEPNWATR